MSKEPEKTPPLQWSRIPKDAEGSQGRAPGCRRTPGFNGAASRRTRKACGCAAGGSSRCSSFNGAASRRTRKARTGLNTPPRRSTLQWSRIPKDAEGSITLFDPDGEFLASMEPHPEGRGRGTAAKKSSKKKVTKLQWSRIPKDAEGAWLSAAGESEARDAVFERWGAEVKSQARRGSGNRCQVSNCQRVRAAPGNPEPPDRSRGGAVAGRR